MLSEHFTCKQNEWSLEIFEMKKTREIILFILLIFNIGYQESFACQTAQENSGVRLLTDEPRIISEHSVSVATLSPNLQTKTKIPIDREDVIPDTPAGRQLAEFIRAYNSGDIKMLRRFVEERYAKSALEGQSSEVLAVLWDYDYKALSRGYVLKEIQKSGDYEMTALLQGRLTELWFRLTLTVEEKSPYAIMSLQVNPTPPPPANQSLRRGKMNEGEIVKSIEPFLDKLAGADYFSGSVLIAKDGKPFYKKAYGMANKSFNIANRVDTKFNLASLGKMFTGVAVTQLVEQGKLAFDEPIGKYLPEYPNKKVAEKVTIHRLLMHTSGLGSSWGNERFECAKNNLRTVNDYLELFINQPLAFEPGERFLYSNDGFILMGAIIEKVTGQSYYDYVEQNIFKPAGMTNTDYFELDEDTPNMAVGYTYRRSIRGLPQPAERGTNQIILPAKGSPAGGAYSTVEDLLKFDAALRQHKLLNPKYTDILLTGKEDSNRLNVKKAYGFFDETVNGQRIVSENGGFAGVNTQIDMYPELGYTVIVLSNYDGPAAIAVVNKIRDMLARVI